jgi:hypothetical protein
MIQLRPACVQIGTVFRTDTIEAGEIRSLRPKSDRLECPTDFTGPDLEGLRRFFFVGLRYTGYVALTNINVRGGLAVKTNGGGYLRTSSRVNLN